MQRLDITVRHEIEVLMHKLQRNFVETIAGNAVFNYPTLAEAYKIAALDAWNKL